MSGRKRTTLITVVVSAWLALVGAVPVLGVEAVTAAPADAHVLGTGPINDILAWADADKACGLSRDQLAAMMLTPVYFEVGDPTTQSPSPMTLSRFDTSAGLYSFGTTSTSTPKAFFHPGVGLWQFDSAGGWPLTAATAINTFTSASQAASVMSSRWCSSSGTDVQRRAFAWGPWSECTSGNTGPGTCEDVYNSLLVNGVFTVTSDPNVSSLGGMQTRSCDVAGIGQVTCSYVNPANVQGNAAWTIPSFGPSPVTAPFYVFDNNGREFRYWLSADTGYGGTIEADKPITADARTSLTWRNNQSTLCDLTASRGDNCTNPNLRPWSGVSSLGGLSTGQIAVGRNADGRLELFVVGTDGQLWHMWQTIANGGWANWAPLGGSFPLGATPAVGRNADGRLELFVRGADGAVWHQFQAIPNGGWSDQFSLGGASSADPTVAVNADGRLQVFVRTTTATTATAAQVGPNAPFAAFSTLGGVWPTGTELSPVTNADGRLEVVGTANDGQLWHAWQGAPNGTFSAFFPLGGSLPLGRQVAFGRNADGRLEVFASGSDGQLWHEYQTSAGGGWSGLASLGGTWGTGLAVLLDQSGRLTLAGMGTDGQLRVQVQNIPNGPWAPPVVPGGNGSTPPQLAANADGRPEAFFPGADQSVDHAYELSPP
jgi:hypothetical protein